MGLAMTPPRGGMPMTGISAHLIASLLVAAGCSSNPMAGGPGGGGGTTPDAKPGGGGGGGGGDLPGHTPGMPGLGAHGLHFYHLGADQGEEPPRASNDSISTPLMATQRSGSTIIVSVGRGELAAFGPSAIPTDSMGNAPYQQLGQAQKYSSWPSGTALYAFPSANGGSNFRVTTATDDNDEITIAAVEVVEGSKVSYKWNEDLSPPNTSTSITTTGAATLIAFWWGDGFPGTPQQATPNNGFVVVDTNAYARDSFVQCAVAVKNVSAGGTYNVTWTSTPAQGAQLWLVAVEK